MPTLLLAPTTVLPRMPAPMRAQEPVMWWSRPPKLLNRGVRENSEKQSTVVWSRKLPPSGWGDVATRQQVHGAHVVGFDAEAAVVDDAAQGLEIGFGFDQHLARQHDVLAGGGEGFGDLQPVGQAQFVAAGTHGLAEIDDIHRRVGHVGVEGQGGLAGPVVEQGAEGEFHR